MEIIVWGVDPVDVDSRSTVGKVREIVVQLRKPSRCTWMLERLTYMWLTLLGEARAASLTVAVPWAVAGAYAITKMMMSKAMKEARLQAGKEYIGRRSETRNGYFNHQSGRVGRLTSLSNDSSSTERSHERALLRREDQLLFRS